MKKINPAFFLLATLFPLVFFSCKKVEDTTNLGGGIIPGVDGVTTFDTTFEVQAFNGLFTATDDSLAISSTDDHIAGNITNDPLFGKTNAKLFLELKPPSYRWGFSNIYNADSLHFDSIVLVLGWKATYGDSTAPQRFKVYEIDQSNDFRYDTLYQVRQQYFTYSNLLGTKDFYPYTLNDSVRVFKDSSASQLRIRLNDNFGRRLLTGYDTTNAYASDSAFRTYFKGFAIEPDQSFGNALMAFGLNGQANTKLAIYYRFTQGGKDDTTVSYFTFSSITAHHDFINRNFSGTPLLASQGGTTPDNLVYLINAPGSYATIKIPGLSNFSNRIINRAELSMEEVYDPSDLTFTTPEALYLDVYDSSISKYKAIPYDFTIDNTGSVERQFGMYGQNAIDPAGNIIRTWKFNITRYVQNICTKKEPSHDFRLLAHRFIYETLKGDNGNNAGTYIQSPVLINSRLAMGRVRLGGGNHPTQKMKLRVIYTKI